jgi:sigma-E factor negative regulatory protein RseB
MRRAAGLGLVQLTLLASLGGAVLLFPVARAGANDNADALLARARTAAATHDFVGVVRIEWRTSAGSHVSDVPVSSDQGLVEIGLGSNMVVGEGLDRWAGADGASTLWHDAGPNQLPDPSSKWDLTTAAGPSIVDHATTVIDARDKHGTVRARLYVDRATGLLLRREVLNSHGRAVHIVTFIALSQVDPNQPGGTSPTRPRAAKQRTNDTLTTVPDGYEAPSAAGSGFHLVARYRQGGGVVQLFYSDGLFNVSVFEQPGQLDWGALPSGGTDAHVSDERTLSYETAAGTVMFWNVQGDVFTCISDAPVDQVSSFVTSFANASTVGGGSNPIDDAIHFVLGPFSWG